MVEISCIQDDTILAICQYLLRRLAALNAALISRKPSLNKDCYLERPFLINGFKFDLRLYIMITSFNPLRIYLYEDGLVRYTREPTALNNHYVHLTNTSINKHNPCEAADKWSVRELWARLAANGRDVSTVMERIVDVILKSIICAEPAVVSHLSAAVRYPFSCCELLGFDIILDADLRPWLLEVNISPSLHSGTELDRCVKQPLARDCLNLAGVQIPDMDRPPANFPSTRAQYEKLPEKLAPPKYRDTCDFRVKPCDRFLDDGERQRQRQVIDHYFTWRSSDGSGKDPNDRCALLESLCAANEHIPAMFK